MIGFFPEPYEDELAYSVFARYHSNSGYLCYLSTAEDLYVNPKNKPSIEFLNLLTDDAVNHIISLVGSLDNFIVKHTMFNYYSAFLSYTDKQKAIEYARTMNIKSLMNALPIPKSRTSRYLRYCPLCVKEDRELYEETYWHRSHQLYGVNVCGKHGCYLVDSEVPITSNMPPSLIKAESVINEANMITKALPTEIGISKYNFEILNYSSNMLYNDFSEFLNSCLVGTPYISPRGAKRYIHKLSCDFKEYYKELDLNGFGSEVQLQKLFNGDRLNPFEISLLGHFLGKPASDMVERKKCSTSHSTTEFDNAIKQLKSVGLNYRQIASKLGISYDYCKLIGCNKKIKSQNRKVNCNGGHRVNWEELDKTTLPRVVELIETISKSNDRPQKISVGMVERLVGLKECQLRRLPRCLEYVEANIISQEEFWAKTIIWAVRMLKKEGKSVNITNIMKLTNIRKNNIKLSLQYIDEYLSVSEHSYLQCFLLI